MVAGCLLWLNAAVTTLTLAPVFEPLSFHGTDGDAAIAGIGVTLQGAVMSRPMLGILAFANGRGCVSSRQS